MVRPHVYIEPLDAAKRYLLQINPDGKLFAGRRVLDIGCGTGSYSHLILKSGGAEVVGIDAEALNIHIARQRFNEKGLKFRHSALEHFNDPFGFDVVFARGVIYYFATPALFLALIDSLLIPGGILLVTFIEKKASNSIANVFKKLTSRVPESLQPALVAHLSLAYMVLQKLDYRKTMDFRTVQGKMNTIFHPAQFLSTPIEAETALMQHRFDVIRQFERFKTDFTLLARKRHV